MKCITCGKEFEKKYHGYKSFCSNTCYSRHWLEKHPDYKQSPKAGEKWRKKIKDHYGLGAGTILRYGFRLALKIYEKYNRKCSKCGSENDLTIHHLDNKGRNYVNKGLKANNDEDNLILICRKCHGRIHGKQGKGIKHKKVR